MIRSFSLLAWLLSVVLLLGGLDGCAENYLPCGAHDCVIACVHAQLDMPGIPSRKLSIGFRGRAERHVVLVYRLPGGWRVFDPQTGTFQLLTPPGLVGFPPPLTVAILARPHDNVSDASWYD